MRDEHATSVHGNGKNPTADDLLGVASQIGMDKKQAIRIAQNVQECVREYLRKYLS